MANVILDHCKHDPNQWNFCKNWNGEGNTDEAKKALRCPKEVIRPALNDNEEPTVDFDNCPYHVVGNANIEDSTWGIEDINTTSEPVKKIELNPEPTKPKPKQKSKTKQNNTEPQQANLF
jgi:hypothetical protein